MSMLTWRSLFKFTKLDSLGLSARKYMRSISQSALFYKPPLVRELPEEDSLKDRVVQQFFDSSSLKHRFQVFEAQDRLKQIKGTSTPAHSYYQVVLPFKDNQLLRKKMVQFFQVYIRVGRVLELMDYIAANVAYRYCLAAKICLKELEQIPFIIVTAAIDQIDFFHPIMADTNCSFSGYVSYVGSSSMQVQLAVTQAYQGKQRLCCSAKFVMAARDKKTGKSYKVPAIDLSNQSESFRVRNQLGQRRQRARKLQATRALKVAPPTYEQSSQVHNLLLKIQSQLDKQGSITPIKMSQTTQRNTLLMHLQDKNLSGKIFGGYIMRLAYELGWLTGYRFLNGKFPRCTHIDDVQFLGPVQIGSIVQLQSTISYVDQELMHVIVECRNVQPDQKSRLTNILRINFEHMKSDIRKVYPETMRQTSQYIESMRRVKKYLES